jgi:prepilin-type N-terminal cleavage/methylation domain-containing protein
MKKGFTLIELAIVLVIIGILLGAGLKTADMIESAKSKKVITEVTVLADAQNQFYERTGRYAGDLNNDGLIGFSNINANPVLNGNAANENDPDASFNELKSLNLLSDEPNSIQSQISQGGPVFFAGKQLTINGNKSNYNLIVLKNISCLTAYTMELYFDNTSPDSSDSAAEGSVRYVNNNSIIDNGAWTASNICPDKDTATDLAYILRQ